MRFEGYCGHSGKMEHRHRDCWSRLATQQTLRTWTPQLSAPNQRRQQWR